MQKTLYSELQSIFLAQLRSARERSGLTQSDVAKRLQMQQSDISKCERGVRRLDVVELRLWLRALGTDLSEFAETLEAALSASEERRTQGPKAPNKSRRN